MPLRSTTLRSNVHPKINGDSANGLSAVRSSVAGVRERTVRSTRAAEAVAELGSLGDFARHALGPQISDLAGPQVEERRLRALWF